MSGLSGLAAWALRGGAGNHDDDDENPPAAEGQQPPPSSLMSDDVPKTAEELRAQRLARLEELQRQAQQQQEDPQPMEIDDEKPAPKKAPSSSLAAAPPPAVPRPLPPKTTEDKPLEKPKGKSEPEKDLSPTEQLRKLQRKKELLLKKTLNIALVGSQQPVGTTEKSSMHSSSSSGVVTTIDIGSTEISVASIAEIIATRLSEEENNASAVDGISYLGTCFYAIAEELQTVSATASSNKKQSSPPHPEIMEILNEMQRQVVNYGATCLMEPDLFALAKDAPIQLCECLIKATLGMGVNITLGLGSTTNSFYYQLMEELHNQSIESFETTVATMVNHYGKMLETCDSVLDTEASTSPISIVSALSAMCAHKGVAATVTTKTNQFLLPKPGTPEAIRVIRPTTGATTTLQLSIQQLLSGAADNRPYLGRSGPALQKSTILGLCLKIGIPKTNPGYVHTSIMRQSQSSVEATARQQRQQLVLYQNACQQFIKSLIMAGGASRTIVIQWIADALQVNIGASASRPDPSKVSSSNLMLNLSVVLLKLCEPFIDDEKKQHLIDAGFVSSEEQNQNVFPTTGDDMVPRLGTDDGHPAVLKTPYNPKNSFIPQCFFYCARSLHLGVVPLLSHHEVLLRNVSHYHWQLQSQNRDVRSDPRLAHLIVRQLSDEVPLYDETMMELTMRFCNFEAKVLYDMDDETLRTMPEEFVSDICDILLGVAKQKPRLLRGLQFRYVFKLVVKLLSAKYANVRKHGCKQFLYFVSANNFLVLQMVRNYNLRAQLGDVLYELFLPSNHREVPPSVSEDPLAGRRTYLIADANAQETLAPSLLLLYGEVEHTGYYDKMGHRAKIASLLKYLWESSEHRPAFRRITQSKDSFIKFANGIMNETNTLIATVMQKLPEIREAQEKMKNGEEWGRLSEDEQNQISSRLEDNEREVKSALPLCNKTLQMFGYLNTDQEIRTLFLMEELRSRLVTMLLHVLTKLVGSKGLDLKVDNPEQYDFRPKEMLRDLCAIFALFASSDVFQVECAKSGCDPSLLRSAVKTCRRLTLLTGESMEAFQSLPDAVDTALQRVSAEQELLVDAPDEFLDEILSTFMIDPVELPSGHFVDRSTITQHLLNDPIDPFNREPLTIDQVKPAIELKEKMDRWLEEKRASRTK
jgi:ubiquitin conjugation factor E4 B